MLIYLASQSPRRKEILKKMGINFRVIPSRYRERMISTMKPEALVLLHAEGKARGAVIPPKARYLLSADTLVWCRRRFWGKPKTKAEAFRMLSLLSGCTHSVYTGIALRDLKTDRMWTGVAKTKVTMKRLSKEVISNYLQSVYPLDKAGAYAIQEGPKIVKKIRGSYSNVMGLPVELLRKMFQKIKAEK